MRSSVDSRCTASFEKAAPVGDDLVRCLKHYRNMKESARMNDVVRKFNGATA